ncbi:BZ3500_MvSof-1268-A1-R1_Chr8-1g09825 [Microbotryum saponariae]|uniref:BZ3500_MvSof-1268-A1-R1_Chr8-1g09825 protein n=1 Tax=Microbotryum saponariae TaxID=289078 RepID=A0A2X0MNE6_9BASI|nr:BZ3500_MvSof-1268-A1-R1_Chr8-1g09825 [Microbotryum saponariae]
MTPDQQLVIDSFVDQRRQLSIDPSPNAQSILSNSHSSIPLPPTTFNPCTTACSSASTSRALSTAEIAGTATTSSEIFDLTRAKLERAAQGHLTGRRGPNGLRELVLLSNVFGRTIPTQRPPEVDAEQQRLQLELTRKQEEERWLNSVLDEMLEDPDDEDDDFVAIYVADPNVSDSGFLEQDPHAFVADQGGGRDEVTFDLDREKQKQPLLKPHTAKRPAAANDDEPTLSLEGLSLSPPRSPPIDLPLIASSRPLTLEEDYSSSPPFDPPPLTPDSTPPGPGAASDLLATSTESFAEIDSFQWVSDRSSARGLLALDLSRLTVAAPKPPLSPKPHKPFPEKLFSLHPRSEFSSIHVPPLSGPSLWGDSDAASRPPRSSSVPARLPPSPPSFTSYRTTGIVKSFYDCIDFGISGYPLPPSFPAAEEPMPTRE